MKSLKIIRLSSLEPDNFIKVIYGRNHKFSGFVTGNDRKKSLEIINSKGELLVIEYSKIKSFIIKNKSFKSFDTENISQHDVETVSEPPETPVPEIPDSAEFFENSDYIQPSEINLDYIRNLYKCIEEKNIKNTVTKHFNSFMSGCRNNDINKCISAETGFRRDFEKYYENKDAVRLLAYMHAYNGNFKDAHTAYENMGEWGNASVYAYLSQNYKSAVLDIYSLAKSKPEQKISEKLLYILTVSSLITENAFYFSDIAKTHLEIENGLDYLLYKKGVFKNEPFDLKLEKLSECYKMNKYESDFNIESFPKNVIFGYIFSIDGLICTLCPFGSPKKKYVFDRSTIEQKELSEKLSDSSQDVTLINTAFTSSDGRNAMNIREISVTPRLMADMGVKYYESQNYKPALDCFFYAFNHDEQKEDIFFRIVQCYMSLAAAENKPQNYRNAKKFMDRYGSDIYDKYTLDELYFDISVKTGDSAQISKYLEILIENAENTDKKLFYLQKKTDILFKNGFYSETVDIINQWLELYTSPEASSEYCDEAEKNRMLFLVESCKMHLAESECKPSDESNPETPEPVFSEEPPEASEPEVQAENISKVSEAVSEAPDECRHQENTEFSVIFPEEKGIHSESRRKIEYTICPHPERKKYSSKDFGAEFKRFCHKRSRDIYIVSLFVVSVEKMGFFSKNLLRRSLDSEMDMRREKDYSSVDFILKFLYSAGIVEKLVIESDNNEEYYFITEKGSEFLSRDMVKKLLGIKQKKGFKIPPFIPDNFREIEIYSAQYNIISDAVSTYSKQYTIESIRCGVGYFKSCITMFRNRKALLHDKKTECILMLITPDIPENPDKNLYMASLKGIVDVIKFKAGNNLKSHKYAVIVLSSAFGKEWAEILAGASSDILKEENFYMQYQNGQYSDFYGNITDISGIVSAMLSDNPPEKPENPEAVPEIVSEDVSENEQYCKFMNDSSLLLLTPEQVNSNTAEMISAGKYYCALTYLNAVSEINQDYKPFYDILSMALDNPAEQCRYTSSEIFSIPVASGFIDPEIYEYCMISCKLRAVYYNDGFYDYSLNSFAEDIKNSRASEKYPELKTLADIFSDFRKEFNAGMDCFSDYCMRDKLCAETRTKRLQNQAGELYRRYCDSTESFQPVRIKVYISIMFSGREELMTMLKTVSDGDSEKCSDVENFLKENFTEKIGISDEKIDEYIEKIWDKSAESMKNHGKTTGLSCELVKKVRNHSVFALRKISSLLFEWTEFVRKENEFTAYNEALERYNNKRGDILGILNELIPVLDNSGKAPDSVLNRTLRDICGRLDGSYNDIIRKYYFAGFLKNNLVTLNENGMPDLSSTFYSLPGFSITDRILKHSREPEKSFEERLEQIFSRDVMNNDYGSAVIINRYLTEQKGLSENFSPNIDKLSLFCNFSEKKILRMREDFIADMELSDCRGQLRRNTKLKNLFKSVLDIWFKRCSDTHNYGFFAELVENLRAVICSEAQNLSSFMKIRLEEMKKIYEISEADTEKINFAIENLDYTSAQDYINLAVGSGIPDIQSFNYLDDFWRQYPENYSKCTGKEICKSDSELLSDWISENENEKEKHIKSLLEKLLKKSFKISSKGSSDRISESFSVSPDDLRTESFDVLCIFEYSGMDMLFDYFHRCINNTFVFLDYALTESERRFIARKIKKDSSVSNLIVIIDRITISYLEYNYSREDISNMFLSVTMPFSNWNPYLHENDTPQILTPEDAYRFSAVKLSIMGIYFENSEFLSLILSDSLYCRPMINCWCSTLLRVLKSEDYAGYNEMNSPPYIVTETHIKKVLCDEGFRKKMRRISENLFKGRNGFYECLLIMSYLSYTSDSVCGYSIDEIRLAAENICMKKLSALSEEDSEKIFDSLCLSNILLKTSENRYFFRRENFCELLGNKSEIEDRLLNCMD